MARSLVLLSAISLAVHCTAERAYFLQDDFIDSVNEVVTTWKAGINFDPDTPTSYVLGLLGSEGVQDAITGHADALKTNDDAYGTLEPLPEQFDARTEWANCSTVGEIRDQGDCGSGWAFATTSAFADRLCIATDGRVNGTLSAEEVTFCCYLCGLACYGGRPKWAWDYFERHGVVTGGSYNTTDGCQPYKVKPCLTDDDGLYSCKRRSILRRHRCSRTCYGDEGIDYRRDHRKTRDAYYLTYAAIQKDVMVYGPVEASLDVYDDFVSYESGIYVKSANATYLGGHSVKLIGWGETDGVPYWLLVNSWGEHWGDNGTFKIRRGTNECGIDNSTTAGVPVVY